MKNQNNRYALQYINDGDVCAEIGVWQGHLSRKILRRNPSELHLIDPWMTQNVIERCYSIAQDEMEEIYRQVYNNFNKFNEITIHRKFSTQVSFPDNYFDWVYIDGDHSYDAVKKDLEFYYPLMKKGGHLCIDDYGLWADNPKKGFGSDGGGGPKPAADEFVKKYKLKTDISRDQCVIFV